MNGVLDELLVEEIKKGNDESFALLFERYRHSVYAICYRFTRNEADAKELVQDVFIKVYRHINSFKGESKFFTWLYRIAVNTCLSYQRRHNSFTPLPDPVLQPAGSFEERIIMKKAIDDALARLPKRQRMVFILRHYEGYRFEEIASIMRITTGAAKAHHYLAIRKLRSLLKEWL